MSGKWTWRLLSLSEGDVVGEDMMLRWEVTTNRMRKERYVEDESAVGSVSEGTGCHFGVRVC